VTITLNQALETVQELPQQQQDMLFEILFHRRVQARRENIVQKARQAHQNLRDGLLQPQSAKAVLREFANPPLPPPVRLLKPLTEELLSHARREGRA